MIDIKSERDCIVAGYIEELRYVESIAALNDLLDKLLAMGQQTVTAHKPDKQGIPNIIQLPIATIQAQLASEHVKIAQNMGNVFEATEYLKGLGEETMLGYCIDIIINDPNNNWQDLENVQKIVING